MGEVTGLHERPSLCSLSDCWGAAPPPVLPLAYVLSTPHLHFFPQLKYSFLYPNVIWGVIQRSSKDNRCPSYSLLEAPVIPGAYASSGQMPCPGWHNHHCQDRHRCREGQPASAKLPPPPSGLSLVEDPRERVPSLLPVSFHRKLTGCSWDMRMTRAATETIVLEQRLEARHTHATVCTDDWQPLSQMQEPSSSAHKIALV